MITRRRLLHVLAASGVYSIMPHLAVASVPGDNRLVVVILRGAMDGLDVVQPIGDPAYARLRPHAAAARTKAIDLDGFFALHPSLASLESMYRNRELSFVHAVATPYRNRSHFEGQDILEQGTSTTTTEHVGWLNRLLGVIGKGAPAYAVDIGPGSDLVLRGPNKFTSWYPEINLDLKDSVQFLQALYEGDPILEESFARIQQANSMSNDADNVDPGVSAKEIAQLAGKLLNEESRIAAFSLRGWDTHIGQVNRMPHLLKSLADTLLTLKSTLGKNWEKTAVVTCSEFGRTARFNGTNGTDHGTAGVAILAGGALAGGSGGKIITKWPGLAESQLYEDRDLLPTDDVRRFAGWLIAELFDLQPSVITQSVFPSLDMGDNLRLL